ncbi:MAG: hypothetical protein KGL91_11175 [Xanthomonadaceae bacterium]|nr:hypothetical protein [Xanthomonadaceae bacterium]
MNNQPMSSVPMNGNPDNFDARLRSHHAAALAQLSPQVQAQLAQRRHAALRGQSARHRHGLRYAAASFATLCALAIGLRLYSPSTAPTAMPATGHAALVVTAPAAATVRSTPAPTTNSNPILEEDPSFYAWLGTPDVRQLAME